MKRLDGEPRSDKGGTKKYATVEERDAARKEQRRQANRRYRERNLELLKQKSTEYRAKNREICIERTKTWQAENPERVKDTVYRRKYGISLGEYKAMVDQRGGKCDICATVAELVIDHCHANGHVRGLLCDRCNVALGCIKDSPVIALSAAQYLTER